MIADGAQVYDERNLVILSRYEITDYYQYKHSYTSTPHYRKVAVQPEEYVVKKVTWERPILHTKIKLDERKILHVINLHLKSKRSANIPGQKVDIYTWKTASGGAEGFFLPSMKRVSQALENRMLIDKLFDRGKDILIVVCRDFNEDFDKVPLKAIRGDIENIGNSRLTKRVMMPCECTIPELSHFSLLHHDKRRMIDHLLVSRSLLVYYRDSDIHNELLHDKSISFAAEEKYPESDQAPVILEFELPDG